VFLLNYREEFHAFSETDALLYRMAGLLATAHAKAGHTQLSHVPLLFILKRQALNAFEAISTFQGYQGWATLRPGIEAALVSGKWIEDPAIAQVWRDPEQHKTAYIKNYSGKGLVSSALPHSEEFRMGLNRINDQFVHTNYKYFEKHTRLQEVDAEHLVLQFTFNDDAVEHRAHVYAFLHLTRLLVSLSRRDVRNAIRQAPRVGRTSFEGAKLLEKADGNPCAGSPEDQGDAHRAGSLARIIVVK
jgi:hypothetical protein